MTAGCTNRPGSNPVVVESEVLVCRPISSLCPLCFVDLRSACNNTVRKGSRSATASSPLRGSVILMPKKWNRDDCLRTSDSSCTRFQLSGTPLAVVMVERIINPSGFMRPQYFHRQGVIDLHPSIFVTRNSRNLTSTD